MVQRIRGQGDTIPRASALLKTMGHCRGELMAVSDGVRPFGTVSQIKALFS